MRLFLALQFDRKFNKTLTGILHDLKVSGIKGNFVPSQNLHITLVFLGETDRLPEIKTILSTIPVPSMRITLDKLSKHGNILLADVKCNQKLKEYTAAVRTALDTAGIDFDHKEFKPHITLVRKAMGSSKDVQIPRDSVMLQHVSLMKSVRKDGKMVYTEVAGWGK